MLHSLNPASIVAIMSHEPDNRWKGEAVLKAGAFAGAQRPFPLSAIFLAGIAGLSNMLH